LCAMLSCSGAAGEPKPSSMGTGRRPPLSCSAAPQNCQPPCGSCKQWSAGGVRGSSGEARELCPQPVPAALPWCCASPRST
jgi:hypothetical protein